MPVTNLALMAFTSLSLIVTSRYLGLSDRGLYLTWSSWCAMVGTLAMLGTPSFIVVAANHLGVRVSVWGVRRMLGLGIAVASLVALAIMIWWRAPIGAVVGGVLLAASGPVVAVHASAQQANGHHGWRFNLARGLTPAAGLCGVLLTLLLLRPGPGGLFLGFGAGCLAGALTALWIAYEPANHESALGPRIWELSRRGAPLAVLGWLLLNVDTVVVSIAASSADVGLYGVGVAARSVVMAVGTAVGLRWFAKRTTMGSSRGMALVFLPSAAVAIAIVACSPFLVPMLLGEEFAPSVPAVQLLCIAGVLASVDFLLMHVVIVESGYFVPTIMRLALVALLVVSILIVHGDPTVTSVIYGGVMLVSIAGQVALVKHRSRLRVAASC